MKYYIGQESASGIETKTWNEFVNYLHDEMLTRQENGDEYFTVTIENENSDLCRFLREIRSEENANADDVIKENPKSVWASCDTERNMERCVVGYKEFGDTIDITDPGYDRNVWCRKNGVKIVPGTYECVAWRHNFPYEGREDIRVCIAGIYLTGVDKNDIEWSPEEIANIGVDAGLAGFFQNKPDYTADEWRNLCDKLGYSDDAWILPEGFCTSSGFGDGGYPVYVARNKKDEIIAVEIEFIGEGDIDTESTK